MNTCDNFWSGHIQNLVAALVALEIVKAGIRRLQHGPHGTVSDYHPGCKGLAQSFYHDGAESTDGSNVGTR